MSGARFTGSGSGLTSLSASSLASGTVPTARLPVDAAANTWASKAVSSVSETSVGVYAMLVDTVNRTTGFGNERPGSDLAYSSTSGDDGNRASGTWRCMGRSISGGDSDNRRTLWQKVA
jgi:hypothetical protein